MTTQNLKRSDIILFDYDVDHSKERLDFVTFRLTTDLEEKHRMIEPESALFQEFVAFWMDEGDKKIFGRKEWVDDGEDTGHFERSIDFCDYFMSLDRRYEKELIADFVVHFINKESMPELSK